MAEELIVLGSEIATKWSLTPGDMGAIGLALIPLSVKSRLIVLRRLLNQSFYAPIDMKTEFSPDNQATANRNLRIWLLYAIDMKTEFSPDNQATANRNLRIWLLYEIKDCDDELVEPFKMLIAEMDEESRHALWFAFLDHPYVRYGTVDEMLHWHARLAVLAPENLMKERLLILLLSLRGFQPRWMTRTVKKATPALVFILHQAFDAKTPQEFSDFLTAPRYLELKAADMKGRQRYEALGLKATQIRDKSPARSKLSTVIE
jgi:hypothetical protein